MKIDKVFCVIDPSTTKQWSLDRAALIAGQGPVAVHAFLCVNLPQGIPAADIGELQAAERQRYELWVEALVAPLRQQGATVTTEVMISDDWRESLARAAAASDADLVLKASQSRTALQRRFLKTSDWLLLREARCPVLFVKRPEAGEIRRILAAVNIKAQDAAHAQLTDTVLEIARDVAEQFGAELHAVNAYSGSQNFVHPPELAKRAGIERNRAHVGDDDPEDVISAVCEKIDAQAVIIGSVGRKGMAAAVVGNTAERILDTVPADILTIVLPAED